MFEATHAPSSKLILSFIIVIVVAAIIVALYFNFSKFKEETKTVSGPTPVYAAQGEVARGFPAELILDKSARLEQSYAIEYAPDLKQYTASYESSQSMSALHAQYKTYLERNGWKITNEILDNTDSRGLYAKNVALETSVAVINGAQSRQVIISYIIQ